MLRSYKLERKTGLCWTGVEKKKNPGGREKSFCSAVKSSLWGRCLQLFVIKQGVALETASLFNFSTEKNPCSLTCLNLCPARCQPQGFRHFTVKETCQHPFQLSSPQNQILLQADASVSCLIPAIITLAEITWRGCVSVTGDICRARKVFFHTDAAQAVGKIPLDVNNMKIDLMSISGHKIYGPKGTFTEVLF